MTKKFLIVSSINYSTANWMYVVLSRVTSLDGLFLMQPLKPNFNPRPAKLLQQEWMLQRHVEKRHFYICKKLTTLDGLFLMQPLKPYFIPRPTKLLQQEWMFQRVIYCFINNSNLTYHKAIYLFFYNEQII